jgi:tRNA nucleotidyltransferase/poly(A) polymerase
MEKTALVIVRELQEAGHEAYFAGGCVRDRLRGVAPKDYDIATSATPGEILKLYPRAGTIGSHFGVILVRRGGHHFEIATFREDGTYSDGRRPESVSFSTSAADARRRDFTINGLFLDPLTGEVHDYVGGRADLARRSSIPIERRRVGAVVGAGCRPVPWRTLPAILWRFDEGSAGLAFGRDGCGARRIDLDSDHATTAAGA